jgi:hypothetical protein
LAERPRGDQRKLHKSAFRFLRARQVPDGIRRPLRYLESRIVFPLLGHGLTFSFAVTADTLTD